MIKWIIVAVVVIVFALVAKGALTKVSNKINPQDLFSGPMLEIAKAVDRDDIARVKQLAAALDDINALGEHGVTLLVYAVIADKPESIKVLMTLGSDPSIRVPEQGNAGYIAMWHPDAKSLEALLQAGMSPNIKNGKRPLIFHSHNMDESDSLPVLVKYGADVNVVNEKGETPIFDMIRAQPKNALFLLKHGADGSAVSPSGVSVAYSYELRMKRIDEKSAVYQIMAEIKETLSAQGVKFPALSPWGERFVRDIVFCKEPSGYRPRSECKIEGVNRFVKEPSQEIKRQDEMILKERYGIEHQF